MNDIVKKEITRVLSNDEVVGFFAITVTRNKKGMNVPTVTVICDDVTVDQRADVTGKLIELVSLMRPIFKKEE